MDREQSYEDIFEGGKPPVPIPPADRAWSGMEQLLNQQMPVISTSTGYTGWLSVKVGLIAAAVAAVAVTAVVTVTTPVWLKKETGQQGETNKGIVLSSSGSPVSISGINQPTASYRDTADKKTGENIIKYADSSILSSVNIDTALLYTDETSPDQINKKSKNKYKDKHTINKRNKGFEDKPSLSETANKALELSFLSARKGRLHDLVNKVPTVPLRQAASEEKTKGERKWGFWIQLPVTIPLSESKYYASDPKGNNAFYRNLLPSVRVERKLGQSTVSLDLQPFTSSLLPLHADKKPMDTMLTVTTSRHMIKTSGSAITLQYHYPVYKGLVVSAGVGVSRWQKGLVNYNIDTTGMQSRSVIQPAGDDDWKKYSRLSFSGIAELHYNLNKWEAGLRTAVPFNKYSSDPAEFIRKQVRFELIIRRRIW